MRCEKPWVIGLVSAVLTVLYPVHASTLSDPQQACHYLDDRGLSTKGYSDVGRGVYQCRSFSRQLPVGGTANHALYYQASGTSERVQRLELVLEVRSREEQQPAHRYLLDELHALAERAAAGPVPEDLAQAVLSGTSGEFAIGSLGAMVTKRHGGRAAYELVVTLEAG
jgi:hypothetical protein